jgi:hypothetical protein
VRKPQSEENQVRRRRIHLLALGVLAAFGLACGAASPDSDNGAPQDRGGTGEQAAADGKVNTAVRDGDFEFVVSKVECGKTSVGSSQLGVKAQGVFCLVTVSAKNIGDKAQTFTDSSQKAFAGSTEYSTNSTAGIYLEDNDVFLQEINPGNTVKGVMVFDVPKGTVLTKLELHDSAFSGGVTVTL